MPAAAGLCPRHGATGAGTERAAHRIAQLRGRLAPFCKPVGWIAGRAAGIGRWLAKPQPESSGCFRVRTAAALMRVRQLHIRLQYGPVRLRTRTSGP
jgi:hypothetical protein